MRILLADDHQMVRQALRKLLEREGLEVIAEAADGHEAACLAMTHAPDVVLLDISMPRLNGLDAAREILRTSAGIGIVVLTMHASEHHIVAALRAGIRGYILKTQPVEELLLAITEVAEGGTYLTPRVSRVVVDSYLAGAALPSDPLSPRQREVLRLVAEGHTTKEIAGLLGVTVKTAESYRERIMQRLNIHDTAGLVRYAIQNLIIQVDS